MHPTKRLRKMVLKKLFYLFRRHPKWTLEVLNGPRLSAADVSV